MDERFIVKGQFVKHAKAERARELRKTPTAAESQLWSHVRGSRLGYRFRREQIIDGFIVDFYCHAARLVVEVDGEIHEGQVADDAARDRALALRGLLTIRFSNDAVLNDTQTVIAAIRNACIARAGVQ
jgi:very-short-patch-repair endonuclease